MPPHKGGKKGNHKYGRDRAKGEKYAAQGRREKNNPARTRRNPPRTPHK
jgi:hypothetical protein